MVEKRILHGLALAALLVGCKPVQSEYCVLPPHLSPVDRVLAGQEVPKEILFTGDIEKLKFMSLDINNIERINSLSESADRYQMLLVPVGYSDNTVLEERMTYLTEGYRRIFKDLPIDFVFLNTSVPIGIQHIERFPEYTDKEEVDVLFTKINTFQALHGMLIVLNTDTYVGAGGLFPITAGNNEGTLYIGSHEIGHKLGLSDGYQRYYGDVLPNSELFTSTTFLRDDVASVLETKPKPIPINGVCNGDQLYTFFDPSQNIMVHGMPDAQLLELAASQNIFNPLQQSLMERVIRLSLHK